MAARNRKFDNVCCTGGEVRDVSLIGRACVAGEYISNDAAIPGEDVAGIGKLAGNVRVSINCPVPAGQA